MNIALDKSRIYFNVMPRGGSSSRQGPTVQASIKFGGFELLPEGDYTVEIRLTPKSGGAPQSAKASLEIKHAH